MISAASSGVIQRFSPVFSMVGWKFQDFGHFS
jgi:hypothetical protein